MNGVYDPKFCKERKENCDDKYEKLYGLVEKLFNKSDAQKNILISILILAFIALVKAFIPS